MVLWIKYLDRVIRGDSNDPSALRDEEVAQPVGGLAILGILLGLIYGACMGCFGLFQRGGAAMMQLFATTVKVPTLFFLTLAVTLPSLYVLNALIGSRISLLSVIRVLVISLAVMLAVLVSLGPIVAFFSASTTSYPFMLLLNVLIFSTSGFLGLRYLHTTLARLNASQDWAAPTAETAMPSASSSFGAHEAAVALSPAPEPIKRASVRRSEPQGDPQEVGVVFSVWMVVFGLVGGQMGWVLRPFVGELNKPVRFFREDARGNAYLMVAALVQHVMKR